MSFPLIYPFQLDFLPPQKPIKNEDFSEILLQARVELAELKGACGQIANPLLLTAPAIIRESVASSNIENINTTLVEALQEQLFPEKQQSAPDKEVLRYREALFWGFEHIEALSLSTRTIVGIQKKLMSDGTGEYRKGQNKIVNSITGETLYTPPAAPDIPGLIGNWEHYVHDDTSTLDPLIRVAISHYQFEAIHPFNDGNGRTGRILMVLQLIKEKLLTLPILYISGYINRHRSEYYQLLRGVTTHQNWHPFLAYLLKGFYLQAKETKEDLQKIVVLFRTMKEVIKIKHKKMYSAELVEALFSYPIISPSKLGSVLSMHYTTTSRYLLELTQSGLLRASKVGKYHFFANHQLMNILMK